MDLDIIWLLQMSASHAVPDSDYGPGHFGTLDIDQMKEVSGVIEPARWYMVSFMYLAYRILSRTIVAKRIFIDHAALALLGHIGHPDTADTEAILF